MTKWGDLSLSVCWVSAGKDWVFRDTKWLPPHWAIFTHISRAWYNFITDLKLGLVCQLENLDASFQRYPASLMIQKELVQRKHQCSEYTQAWEGTECFYKSLRCQNITCFTLGVTQITVCSNPRGSHRDNIPLWEEDKQIWNICL